MTLILDEVDTIFGKRNGTPSETKEMLRGVLDSGWRRGGQYVRMVGQGTQMEPKGYKTFGAKMLIGIGVIPGTLGSRSIRIELRRRRRDTEPIERFRIRKVTPEGHAIRDQLAAWTSAHMEELRVAEPVMPEELSDRMWDSWEPLLAIADLASGDWPARARKAAVVLCGENAIEDESTGVRLLADLREYFDGEPVFTTALLAYLNNHEESPWGTWNQGKGMRSQDLAGVLKRYGIKPRTVRVNEQTAKGYNGAWFEDVFSRYLPSDGGKNVTTSQHYLAPSWDESVINANNKGHVTAVPQIEVGYKCDDVTGKKAQEGERDVLEVG